MKTLYYIYNTFNIIIYVVHIIHIIGELVHLLTDAAAMHAVRCVEGGWGMAAHNYDGDVLTDAIAQVIIYIYIYYSATMTATSSLMPLIIYIICVNIF